MADQGVTAINAGLMLLRACTTDLDEKVEALGTLVGDPVAEPFRRIVAQLRAVAFDIEVRQLNAAGRAQPTQIVEIDGGHKVVHGPVDPATFSYNGGVRAQERVAPGVAPGIAS